MKNRKKTVVLILALGLILAMMIGGIVAEERTQSCVVYTGTSQTSAQFTASSPEGTTWSWAISKARSGTASLTIWDHTSPNWTQILNKQSDEDAGGAITIIDGHTYTLVTTGGSLYPPGIAACSVSEGDYNQSRPQGP